MKSLAFTITLWLAAVGGLPAIAEAGEYPPIAEYMMAKDAEVASRESEALAEQRARIRDHPVDHDLHVGGNDCR
jgi:hypothetical protein